MKSHSVKVLSLLVTCLCAVQCVFAASHKLGMRYSEYFDQQTFTADDKLDENDETYQDVLSAIRSEIDGDLFDKIVDDLDVYAHYYSFTAGINGYISVSEYSNLSAIPSTLKDVNKKDLKNPLKWPKILKNVNKVIDSGDLYFCMVPNDGTTKVYDFQDSMPITSYYNYDIVVFSLKNSCVGKTYSFKLKFDGLPHVLTVDPNEGILVGGNFGAANGTSGPATVNVKEGASSYHALGSATRENYEFNGWYTAKTGGAQVFDASGMCVAGMYWDLDNKWRFADDLTVYAQWSLLDTSFALDLQGGESETKSVSVKFGSFMPTIVPPVREGFTFEGYFAEANGGGVRYYNADGTGTRGCDLMGNVTLYAYWTSSDFLIVLHKNDGTDTTYVVEENGNGAVLPGAAKDLKWAPRRGFVFKGWSTSEKSKVVLFKDKQDVSNTVKTGGTLDVYAIWQLDATKSYAIQYIRNDGSGMVRTIGFNYGEPKNLNSVVALGFARRGYTFGGWALSTEDARNKIAWKQDMDEVSTAAQPGKLLKVYAIWTLTEGYYTIRFNKNDGTGAWRELGYEYGKNTTLPTIENGLGWGRPGYIFVGWRTKAEIDKGGSKIWLKDKGVTKTPIAAGKTLSIYAIWAPNISCATDVCTRAECFAGSVAGTPVPVAQTVQALAYFADGASAVVETRIESDGFTVVELGGSVYCGYVLNGVGELLGPDGSILLVVAAVN